MMYVTWSLFCRTMHNFSHTESLKPFEFMCMLHNVDRKQCAPPCEATLHIYKQEPNLSSTTHSRVLCSKHGLEQIH